MDNEFDTGDVEVIESESLKFGGDPGDKMLPSKRKKNLSGMAAFVVKMSRGLIKTELQADIVLIIVSLVIFAISLFLFF